MWRQHGVRQNDQFIQVAGVFFYARYLAKYMFLKECRAAGADPYVEFFKATRQLFNNNEGCDEDSAKENDDENMDDFI